MVLPLLLLLSSPHRSQAGGAGERKVGHEEPPVPNRGVDECNPALVDQLGHANAHRPGQHAQAVGQQVAGGACRAAAGRVGEGDKGSNKGCAS